MHLMLSCIGMHLLTSIPFFALQCICWQILLLFLHCNASVGKFYSFFFTLQRPCTIFAGGGTSQEKQNSVWRGKGWQHLSGWLWNPQRQGKQIWLLKISYISGVSTGWKGGKKDKGRWFFRFITRCLILTRWTPFNGCPNGLVLPWGTRRNHHYK